MGLISAVLIIFRFLILKKTVDTVFMTEFGVRRWQKEEKDRLYVKASIEGEYTSVGYVDTLTGFTRVDHPDYAPETVYAAAAAHAIKNEIGLPAMQKMEGRNTISQHNADLSRNKAGKSLKENSTSRLKRIVTGTTDSWSVGAKGEASVGKILDKTRDLKTLHSIVINEHGADIDHVVFGPNGIYTINTKTHYGATISVNSKGFLVNGTTVSHVKKAKWEALRVSEVLSAAAQTHIPVTPVIAIVGAKTIKITVNTGVIIVPEETLVSTIHSRSSSLELEQVKWLYQAARLPETWLRKK
jgi:hypothetical protein